MANLLERFGIKEVADVTFYEIDKTTQGPKTPVLYLDTLKVSTIEQTAENVSARGGKGNPELIIWDYNKEITVTLEDALFSAKSMAVMFGAKDIKEGAAASATIYKSVKVTGNATTMSSATETIITEIAGNTQVTMTNCKWLDAVTGATITASAALTAGHQYIVNGQIAGNDKREIIINADTFPGNYYITGDTYARSEIDGTDEMFQFIIPKAKVLSEVTLTMEAEGDPSTFNLNLKVLRPSNGEMMKLVQYKL